MDGPIAQKHSQEVPGAIGRSEIPPHPLRPIAVASRDPRVLGLTSTSLRVSNNEPVEQPGDFDSLHEVMPQVCPAYRLRLRSSSCVAPLMPATCFYWLSGHWL